MSQAYSGYAGNVVSGSTDIDAQGYNLDYEVGTFDSSTTADAGWEDTGAALKKVSGSFDFFFNPAKKPTGATANLSPGSTPTMTFYVNKVDDVADTFAGKGLITKLSLKSKVKDGYMVTASFTSKGVWTVPT